MPRYLVQALVEGDEKPLTFVVEAGTNRQAREAAAERVRTLRGADAVAEVAVRRTLRPLTGGDHAEPGPDAPSEGG